MTPIIAGWRSLGLALFCLVGAGCGTPPNQFFIAQNQIEKNDCLIDTDETVYRSLGRLDVRLVHPNAAGAYFAFPLVKNDLPEDATSGAQPNRIQLEDFVVDIEAIGAAPSAVAALLADLAQKDKELLHFRQRTSGSVAPGGRIATNVLAIPAELAHRFRDAGVLRDRPFIELGARLRVVGRRGAGVIESDAFLFPIRLCDGCLVNIIDSCPLKSEPTNLGNQCNVAQDSVVDCCTSGDSLICPPAVAAP